ncbi:TauD/TfdA family dioxygenase [Actinoplanes sp. NPDC026619]|uniref:TauD/TfdA family dioxygenase n=1 Tax=Actinoplanes sp. NPDC026619 TaxID=3155798 RepID=UPI0033F47AD2
MAHDVARLLLSPPHSAALRELASRAVAETTGDRLHRLALLGQELPIGLRRALVDFRLTGGAGLVIGGLPLHDADLGASPPVATETPRHDELARADAMLLLVASFLGYPVSQAGVDGGRLVRDISPAPGHEATQLGSSSSAELMWHTEDAFHPLRPDWVCLLCLRNPDRTATSLAPIDDVPLDDRTRAVLFEPRFLIRPDSSNSADWQPHPVPVLTGDRQRPFVRIDPAFMTGNPADPEAAAALATLVEAVGGRLRDVPLAPGEILLIDNFRSVHGRRPFTARYDGRDRWLRTVCATADLRRSEGLRTGRAIGVLP